MISNHTGADSARACLIVSQIHSSDGKAGLSTQQLRKNLIRYDGCILRPQECDHTGRPRPCASCGVATDADYYSMNALVNSELDFGLGSSSPA